MFKTADNLVLTACECVKSLTVDEQEFMVLQITQDTKVSGIVKEIMEKIILYPSALIAGISGQDTSPAPIQARPLAAQ